MNLTLHPLKDYLRWMDGPDALPEELKERTVELVSCNSQEVVPGTLFLCKGARFKEEYLADAVRRGAFAYVSERAYPGADLPWVPVADIRRAMAGMAALYYNYPCRYLTIIGVTGTKGKSTTAYYLKHILDEYLAPSGKTCGVISSIDTWDGVERFESHLTTPEPLELQRHFYNALMSGMEYLVMEVSSQALKYHRTLGVDFTAGVFLNIGTDHISPIEHPDFEDYFHSKLKLFSQCGLSFVNLDCGHAQEALEAARSVPGGAVFTFSRRNPAASVYAHDVRKVGEDILFQVDAARLGGEYRLSMPGLFNVDNALAAIAVCQGLGLPPEPVRAGLAKARVPGRMEVYASRGGEVTAIVDYAHNRLSFETLFHSVAEEYPGRRIVTVFGCPGKKAFDRRRDLGEVAGAHSDLVILTEEDSGEEDTLSICQEIAAHVACPWEIQPNRGEAIRRAVLSCREPSVLLITGKGAETRQKRGLEYIDTPSDVDYVKTFLREYDARWGRS